MKLRGKKVNERNETGRGQAKQADYTIVISPNGNQVEFFDNVYNPHAISGEPNITRIVFGQPYRENGQMIASDGQRYSGLPEQTNRGIQPLYHAKVSWYNENDAVCFDKDGKDMGRREAYTDVVLGVDLARINRKDMEYCKVLFKGLLDHARVEQYRYTGMLVDPAHTEDARSKKAKCGNYIGHVAPTKNGGYTKYFNGDVGERIHESPEMVEKRKKFYERLLESLNREDEDDRQEIMKLQKKISSRESKRNQVIKAINTINEKDEMEK